MPQVRLKMEKCFIFIFSVILIAQSEGHESEILCRDPLKEYKTCQIPNCQRTCSSPQRACDADDCITAVDGCYCKDGYVLNEEAKNCVPIKACFDCDKNDVFSECGGCDGTCEDPYPICTKICRIGCFCKPGNVRFHGVCIPIKACPSKNSSSSECD